MYASHGLNELVFGKNILILYCNMRSTKYKPNDFAYYWNNNYNMLRAGIFPYLFHDRTLISSSYLQSTMIMSFLIDLLVLSVTQDATRWYVLFNWLATVR